MTGTGVRDPENPDRWLVAPWPADASFGDVVQHFDRASATQFHAGTSAACLLASGAFTDQADWDRRGYLLNCAELGVTIFRDLDIVQHGHDPQTDEDRHVQAVKHRHNPQSPEP